MIDQHLYYYKAQLIRVVDGDTLRLEIDLGFTIKWVSNCRLHGVNAPELHADDETVRVKALEAKQFLINTTPLNLIVKGVELDKYGRPLIQVYFGKDWTRCLNQELLDNGYAIPFMVH